MLKPQDLVVACGLAAGGPEYRVLASRLGMSVSEAHGGVRRLRSAGLVSSTRELNVPQFLELITHGARYVWPLVKGAVGKGLVTGSSAPMLRDLSDFPDPPDLPLVWSLPEHPDAVLGEVIAPLYPSVPTAALRDPDLYALLALVDAARSTSARERMAGVKELRRRLEMTQQDREVGHVQP